MNFSYTGMVGLFIWMQVIFAICTLIGSGVLVWYFRKVLKNLNAQMGINARLIAGKTEELLLPIIELPLKVDDQGRAINGLSTHIINLTNKVAPPKPVT